MSKYTQQDIIEETGSKLLHQSLDSNFFILNDFSASAGKDKYPDIDGHIRLRDGNRNYLNLYLHYQLKSTSNLQSEKYYCEGKVIDYLISTNVPTLLIIADIKNEKIYWFFIDEERKRKLCLISSGNSNKTLDLSKKIINVNNSFKVNQLWQKIAKEDNYTKSNDAIGKIAASVHQDIQKCLGLIYLLRIVPKSELIDLFHNLLQIEKSQIEMIISRVVQEGIVSATANYYLLDNEQIGIESLYKLLSETSLSSFEATFKNEKDRKRILGQLANVKHEIAQNYLSKLADELLSFIKKPTNNDDVFLNLELLNEYAFRVPDKTIAIVKTILSATPMLPTFMNIKGLGIIEGKTHKSLIHKSIEILDRIRYQEKEVFDVLIELSKTEDSSTMNQVLRVLENMAKYNLHILRQIGYDAQIFMLERMESWKDNQLIQAKNVTILICKELLSPSFGGTSMKDYKTFIIHSGSLKPTAELQGIRRRSLSILKKMYLMISDLVVRKEILSTMKEATQTPHNSNYGDDMEQMVVDDTNNIIEYYLSILSLADNELLKEIDEQTYWFSRRFGQKKLHRLNELKNELESKVGYDIFKIFVGYDTKYDDGMNWNKARETRQQKIQEIITDIKKSNLTDWEKKILIIIKNYCSSDPGKFQYFNFFLYEFAKQKPDLAISFLKKTEYEPFLIHLIAGIWNSYLQNKAKKIITDWTKEGQHLKTSARLFEYVESVDENMLNKIYLKAKNAKDIQALNNIICSIARNYPKKNKLKELFIKTIIELTKRNNYDWIDNVWYWEEVMLRDFNENDFEIILKNLLMLPNIEYHAEEILMPIAIKYPEKIIEYFYRRVLIKSKRENKITERYEAIPFSFHKITEPLRRHESIILPLIFDWYGKRNSKNRLLFRWEASDLIEKIFPMLSPALEQMLVNMVNNNNKDTLEIVFSVLSKHQGQDYLWEVVKAIVIKYSDSKNYSKIKVTLFSYLSQTEIVSGEYGFVIAMQNKKQQLQQLKNITNSAFKSFNQDYETYLDQRIAYEQKCADEDIEFRKREISK